LAVIVTDPGMTKDDIPLCADAHDALPKDPMDVP
jgi:hypothetical protein